MGNMTSADAKSADIPQFFQGRLMRFTSRATKEQLQVLVDSFTCFEAVYLVFICLDVNTVIKMYWMRTDGFRDLITPFMGDLAGPDATKEDLFLFVMFLKADLLYYLDLPIMSPKRSSYSIMSVLSNFKRSLMPEELQFIKFASNLACFKENYGRDLKPRVEGETRKSSARILSHSSTSHQERLNKWDMVSPKFFPSNVQAGAAGVLEAPRAVTLPGLLTHKEIRSHLFFSKSRGLLGFNTIDNTLSMVRNGRLSGKFEIPNFYPNFDICYDRKSGILGVMTIELINKGLRVHILRLFATNNALRLIRAMMLDQVLGISHSNTSFSPSDAFIVDFMKVANPQGNARCSVLIFACKTKVYCLALAQMEKLMKYEGERESVASIAPLSDNYLLIGYENFAIHLVSFVGFNEQTLVSKLWLPGNIISLDVPISIHALTGNSEAMVIYRYMTSSTILSFADRNMHYVISDRDCPSIEKYNAYWSSDGCRCMIVSEREVWIETFHI